METYQKINTACLILLTTFAFAITMAYTKVVMIPFVLAIFAFLTLSPVIDLMQVKLKIPRSLSVVITIFLFSLASALITLLVASSINSFVADLDKYTVNIQNLASFLEGLSLGGIEFRQYISGDFLKDLPFMDVLKKFSGGVLNITSTAFLVTVFTLFMLLGESKQQEHRTYHEIKLSISKYVGTKTALSFATATIIFMILAIFKVELAFMFAIITFLFNFIPNIGSILAVLIPIPVLLLQFGISFDSLLILTLMGITQFAIGNVLEPKLMGDSTGLHPVTILFFLTFWGFLWGIPGMFLSVPITSGIKIVLSKFEMARPMVAILEGKSPI